MNNPQTPNSTPSGMGNFSENPSAHGDSPITTIKIRPEDLIKYVLYDDALTSTFSIARLFSLKKRKFVKPAKIPKGTLEYMILPGTYLIISAYVHKKKDVNIFQSLLGCFSTLSTFVMSSKDNLSIPFGMLRGVLNNI